MKILILSCALILSVTISKAQGTTEDYRRAETADTSYLNKVYNVATEWEWDQASKIFWYAKRTKAGIEYMEVDIAKRSKTRAFDHQKFAKGLSAASGKTVNPYKLPIDDLKIKRGKAITFVMDSTKWECVIPAYTFQKGDRLKPSPYRYWGTPWNERIGDPIPSPDGNWIAVVKNSNVYLRDAKTKEEFRLSNDGSEGEYYSPFMQWSPDSKKLMAYKVRPGAEHKIYFVESSPSNQLQPKLQSRDYLKPGDALPIRMPQLFLIDQKSHVKISHEQFADQYQVGNIGWRKDSRSFYFEYNQRGHQRYKIVEVEAPTGKINILVDEQAKTFFDYSGKKFIHYLQSTDGSGKDNIIWMSERDGWNHLYLYDWHGNVVSQITKGEWVVRDVIDVDVEKKQIFFAASGMDAGIDPYFRGVFRINFDGSNLTRLTPSGTDHTWAFSPDRSMLFDISQRSDLPPAFSIRSGLDGKEIMELEKADPAALYAAGWSAPEPFVAKGRDGKTDIWGHIIKPSNFDANKKYPVIEYIYAGPHSSFVPKVFNSPFRTWHQLAELGFIIVQMDGMGTSNRSKAFHDVCWQNLKDAGFPDRILWIKEAAKTRPYMDISRIGIFGNSAGGQSSLGAMLHHPEFYKVAVSSSGCHDNRMDKIWWNEQWMGYPIGPQYAESSNVTHAHKLQGKLLLILGELDDNVDPASTMQVIDKLIKAKKNFDFLMVPGMGHSMGGDYGERKRRDFFVKHLLGVEPPAW